jgi:hypothetical protein
MHCKEMWCGDLTNYVSEYVPREYLITSKCSGSILKVSKATPTWGLKNVQDIKLCLVIEVLHYQQSYIKIPHWTLTPW